MPFDPYPPSKRGSPCPQVELWWSKYRHTTGMVTECIAPNRQRIFKATFGNPIRRAVGYTANCWPLLCMLGTVKLSIDLMGYLHYEENKKHWD